VQADVYEATASIAICGITTDPTSTPFTRPQLRPSPENGLRQPSRVMVDKVTTVPRERLRDRVGQVTEGDMLAVSTALALFLDIPT
jgi:mRNA interferase MazF